MFALIPWQHCESATTCAIFVICIRSHFSNVQHHTIMSHHFTACESHVIQRSRILLRGTIQLRRLSYTNNVCTPIQKQRIWLRVHSAATRQVQTLFWELNYHSCTLSHNSALNHSPGVVHNIVFSSSR